MTNPYLLADLTEKDQAIIRSTDQYTMTSDERRASLINAVDHILKHNIEGAIVECGVWRGGSMMLVAKILLDRGITNRHLYLYDTYEGMSEPTKNDFSFDGSLADDQLANTPKGEGVWCAASFEDVYANLMSTGYPIDHIHLVKGKVESTIDSNILSNWPGIIALLRLDTDWYESTKHELDTLYPMLSKNGALIIDDYGHWQGAKKAVDEYFLNLGSSYFLHRIDYTGRLHIKP